MTSTIQTRAKSTRVPLQSCDENALSFQGPTTRSKLSVAKKAAGGMVDKVQALKGTQQRALTQRTALGDLSNKNAVNNASKVTKSAVKTVLRSSNVITGRKRSGSNPVVERAKTTAIVKNAQDTLVQKAVAAAKPTTRKPLSAKRTNQTIEKVSTKKVAKSLISLEPVEEQYWEDLDKDDAADPLMVAEYVVEIFDYMRTLELTTLSDPAYMVDQAELSWRMRTILVDWLIEVHGKFHLLPETLFLAINILDRFLSRRVVSLVKLQLVGITALFIASKYEEVVHPSVKNFIYLADNGYTEDEVLKSERYVLQVLEFGLHFPNPMNFLRRISKAENYDLHSRTLAKYLMEVTLLDEAFLGITPSKIAAAGAYLARKMLKREVLWSNNIKYYSGGYSKEEVVVVADMILAFLSKPTKSEAVHKKYGSKKFMKASHYVDEWIDKQARGEQVRDSVELNTEDNSNEEEGNNESDSY